MKKFILLFVITILFSCSISKNDKMSTISGNTYIGKNSQERLNFADGKFTLRGITEFIDTLSYGTYTLDNNIITINSNKKLFTDYFEIEVNESFSGSKDSIYVSVDNFINGLYDYENNYAPYLYFNFNSYSIKNEFEESIQFAESIYLANKRSLSKFNLNIIPNLFVYPEKTSGKVFHTYFHEVKSRDNNTFKIKIKGLEEKIFALRIFDGDFIKILNNDTLLWNNELYIKNFRQ